ncbi:cyclin-dependent protein kinase inhibitor SMR8-like [Cornus florida]|uniref:cyclin-dependent protein kinase inhibitor SMR8-like n=1 Tax=Cornus florida TaxID=4283 RepID=UPI00289DE6E9|nr:cyclin-dependent protein kinase inhibitor SMR8-like [Cornus florida]
MGFPEKSQMDGCVDHSEGGKKWVIAGIPLRTPLKPIFTKPVVDRERDVKEDEECSTTPTAVESRIPARLPCPPAPRKRKPSSRCHYSTGVKEFFTPPDLETVFILRHVERA